MSFVRDQRRLLNWATSPFSLMLGKQELEVFITLAKDECDAALAMHALVAKVELDTVGEPDFKAAKTWAGILRIVHCRVVKLREARACPVAFA